MSFALFVACLSALGFAAADYAKQQEEYISLLQVNRVNVTERKAIPNLVYPHVAQNKGDHYPNVHVAGTVVKPNHPLYPVTAKGTNLMLKKGYANGAFVPPEDPTGQGKKDADYHYLRKYAGPIGSIAQTKEQWASGLAQALNIDETPANIYNWGITTGMNWNDWWDGMMTTYPPARNGYELLNFGMVTEPMHRCAAKVPSGIPGHSMPFNHTNAANMYAMLAEESPKPLHKAEVLEISSGRGGGTALISDCFCPSRMVGMDLGHSHTNYAQSRYGREGKCPIEFVQGDALHLPFPDGSFDVVLNVQASHAYPSYRDFVAEAHRILRPGGVLLTSDFRYNPGLDIDALILENVFQTPMKSVDIKDKVLKAFDENHLIQPFVDTCHVDYGLNGLSRVGNRLMQAMEPFAPLQPVIASFMKKSGVAQMIPGNAQPMLPGGRPTLLIQEQSNSGVANSTIASEEPVAAAPAVEDGDRENDHAAVFGKSKSYFYKDMYNTPNTQHMIGGEMRREMVKRQMKAKMKRGVQQMLRPDFNRNNASTKVEMDEQFQKPTQKVNGVPTPLSCVCQAGIMVDTALRRREMEYRMYIMTKHL